MNEEEIKEVKTEDKQTEPVILTEESSSEEIERVLREILDEFLFK